MKRITILSLLWMVMLVAACAKQAPVPIPTETMMATAGATLEPTVTPTLAPTATLTPTFGPTPQGGSNRIVFGLQQRVGEGYEDLGVYLFDLTTQQLTQIAPAGWNLQDASDDGSELLINKGQELYLSSWDGSNTQLVADNLYYFGRWSAVFYFGSSTIVFVGGTEDGTAIFFLKLDGSQATIAVPSSDYPIELSSRGYGILWHNGTCSGEGVCVVENSWASFFDEDKNETYATVMLENEDEQRIGAWYAFSYFNEEGKSALALKPWGEGTETYPVDLPGDILADFAWSPTGATLAVIRLDRSDYDGKVSGTRVFLYEVPNYPGIITELPEVAGLNNRVLWSPDGTYLAFTATELTDTGSRILLSTLRLSDRSSTDYSGAVNLSSSNYLVITNLYWLNLP
jgi:hypothetical protein